MKLRLEYIGNKGLDQAVRAIKAVDKDVAKLDLNRNDLYLNKGVNLIKLLNYLKPGVKEICMRGNGLSLLSCDVLSIIFALMPEHVEKLDLSYNGFYEKDPLDFVYTLAALPRTVKNVKMVGNDLPESTISEIAKVFADRDISIDAGKDDEHGYIISGSTKEKLTQRVSFFNHSGSSEMDVEMPRNTMTI